ncbi:hypothetical protein GGR53DRAFT_508118 [Hypoxylon sp. FL1150]|nr:hypothetical protein GGR53DRAFT_508118 [Hypoxylon sp. FL1150]
MTFRLSYSTDSSASTVIPNDLGIGSMSLYDPVETTVDPSWLSGSSTSTERPQWVPSIPTPPEVLEMPFGEVIERIPWLPRVLQDHLYGYNPRYLYREHPELLPEGIEENVRLDLYAPTFDLPSYHIPLGTHEAHGVFHERQDRYRATASRGGTPPVLIEFKEVNWNKGATFIDRPVSPKTIPGPETDGKPLIESKVNCNQDVGSVDQPVLPGTTPGPDTDKPTDGRGGYNKSTDDGRGGYNQPWSRVRTSISQREALARYHGRGGHNRPTDVCCDKYTRPVEAIPSSRKRGIDNLGVKHPLGRRVKVECDDGRGGYNQPEDGRGGYNQPIEAGLGGYYQPAEDGRSGYN